MSRAHLGSIGFRGARVLLYRLLIPFLMRTGPLEPLALRVFRRLLRERQPTVAGLPCPINTDGLTLWYDTQRPSNTVRALAAGGYEQAIANLFASTLRSGMTVLDVGAHIGYFTLVAGRHVGPTGQVWSFEPDPANRESLEHNIAVNGMRDRVSILPLAVASSVGEATLYRVAGDTGSSTMYPSNGGGASERIAVSRTSLDTWADSMGWPQVDLVKMDTEGAEGTVLAGMTELFERNPSMVVVLEFQADALEAAGEDPADFVAHLLAANRQRVELLNDRRSRLLSLRDVTRLVRRSRWSPLNLAIRGDSSWAR
ncbi:MAG TPA: FkbM family methyltransferase [Solirubrobacteraceae bacterium]|jgi:FkbM family methyltransferase|nr:FkbM family methyltransferase [Solirubrobacteraceae bacterium]